MYKSICSLILIGILTLFHSSAWAQEHGYICIISSLNIAKDSKPFVYASKENLDTDNDGFTNYYENIVFNKKNHGIDLISIFNHNDYLKFLDNSIQVGDLEFTGSKTDVNLFVNEASDAKLIVSKNNTTEKDIFTTITAQQKNKLTTIVLGCSPVDSNYKKINMKNYTPLWSKLLLDQS